VVSTQASDAHTLGNALAGSGYRVHRASTVEEGLAHLERVPLGVVICRADLIERPWQDLLQELEVFQPPPRLILASRLADNTLWAEALNLGAHDLLLMPFEPDEVSRVTFSAWSAWSEDRHRQPAKPPSAASGSRIKSVAASGGERNSFVSC
jgi:DNA-binding NtrC family response regulator